MTSQLSVSWHPPQPLPTPDEIGEEELRLTSEVWTDASSPSSSTEVQSSLLDQSPPGQSSHSPNHNSPFPQLNSTPSVIASMEYSTPGSSPLTGPQFSPLQDPGLSPLAGPLFSPLSSPLSLPL